MALLYQVGRLPLGNTRVRGRWALYLFVCENYDARRTTCFCYSDGQLTMPHLHVI